uniref:uncharacterized protein n=1 Tax=Myxine glutinosa TaxID=7769 RepID=UPI00358F7BBA
MTSQYTLPDLETVLQWSHYDVACCLRKLQLEECAHIAKTHQIDGQRLLELRQADINHFPLPCQGKLCKLVDDIKRADERRNWKDITKKMQSTSTDIWHAGKGTVSRIQQVSAEVWKASKGTVSRLIRDAPQNCPQETTIHMVLAGGQPGPPQCREENKALVGNSECFSYLSEGFVSTEDVMNESSKLEFYKVNKASGLKDSS